MLGVEVHVVNVAVLGISVALFFLLMRIIAGWLIKGPAEPVGTALLNLFP